MNRRKRRVKNVLVFTSQGSGKDSSLGLDVYLHSVEYNLIWHVYVAALAMAGEDVQAEVCPGSCLGRQHSH